MPVIARELMVDGNRAVVHYEPGHQPWAEIPDLPGLYVGGPA